MKIKVYLTIVGLLISAISYSQLSVKKVTSTVAIDGQLDESFWKITNKVSINLGGSNNTAHFGVLWDDNYLYVGINVVDKTLCKADGNSWYSDGVEIYIDGNNSKNATLDEYDRLFAKPVKSYWIQEFKDRYEGVKQQWTKTNNGYSMEFAIPWSNLNISPVAGNKIGFNIAINDDDDVSLYNSLSQLLWIGNSNYCNNPSTWGTLSLSSQTISYSGNYIALITPNGGDFCINNKTTEISWASNGISNINIDYSIDNGSNWNSIATNISASLESYNWNVSASPSKQCLLKISDSKNASINDISKSQFSISNSLTPVGPLIRDDWKVYEWPYNAYYPEDSEGINGHAGNACGPTAVATVLHYWEYPIVGFGTTSIDYFGKTYSANFGATTYNYDNMPNHLYPNSTEEEYTDVATLFYHAATALSSKGANIHGASKALKQFFNYKNSIAYRNDYTRAEWIELLINDLDNERVILMAGLTPELVAGWHEGGGAGHFFHIDGYNEKGQFHVDFNFGKDANVFFDVDSFRWYSTNHVILTGLEPNLKGKELSLQNLNGGEILKAGEVSEIRWNSTKVSKIRIEYTINNGQSWEVITNSTSASAGSYNWTTPDVSVDDCKIKLTDVSDINVYDKSNNVFSVKNPEIILLSPKGGEYIILGETFKISWTSALIENIKIEFSDDNGSNWKEITTNYPANTGNINWDIPPIESTSYKIRISAVANEGLVTETDTTFTIGKPSNTGGPYKVDDNTLVLLHFENNLFNSSSYSDDGVSHGDDISYSNSAHPALGKSLRLKNKSFVSIPHNESLNLTEDWTIELWIYLNSFGSGEYRHPTFVSKSDNGNSNYFLWYQSGWGNIKGQYEYSGGYVYSSIASNKITRGKWYHVKYTRDNSTYVNKVIIRDEELNVIDTREYTYGQAKSIPLTNNNDLLIGKILDANNCYIDGYIDELRISNIVRDFVNAPQADFLADSVTGTRPLEINFTDLSKKGSKAIRKWSWDFDNDGTVDSHDQNPTWTYNDVGVYSVSLIVSDGTNPDTLTKTDYINVKDIDPNTRILLRSNDYFEVWGLTSEDAAADTIIKVLTANYNRIADSLNVQLSEVIVVDVYRDLLTFHTAIGWPDAPDWLIGNASDSTINLVSPYNPGPEHSFNSIISVITHELVHCFVHKLAEDVYVSKWINEGSATYLSYQTPEEYNICNYINKNNGKIPTLAELNNGGTFGDIGGYSFSYTIVEYIVIRLGGSDILSQFLASGMDYLILGFENELEFQDEWNQYIYINYRCDYCDLHAAFLADTVSGKGPLEINFSDYSVQGSTAINQWSWDFDNDGTIDSYDQNPIWTYNEKGTYSVSLTVGDGTNTNTYIKTDYIDITGVKVSINDNFTENESIHIYPNPAHVKVNISMPGTFSLLISTITGQIIVEKNSFDSEILDVSNIKKGIYIVTIKDANRSISKKLIIE